MRTNIMRKKMIGLLGAIGAAAVFAPGCLSRPVETSPPGLVTTFTTTVRSDGIDKIDLLFVIDNSASMGDKQEYLAQAVPDLITRLVTPNCVDPSSGTVFGPSDAQGSGTCAQGKVEFPPAHDMHIGVLSTSLGSRLSGSYKDGSGIICDPGWTLSVQGVTISNHNDDRGELLNRSGPTETPLADAGTSFYLNWFPNSPLNQGKTASAGAPAITSATQLIADFRSLIQGVGNYGCGIESPLESWYRFLIQPDPYDSLTLDAHQHAQWSGVDATILKQRHDFLRPDSLVAIIDMTDENDSEIDVRALGGQGYLWMAQNFDPPRATSGCAEDAANNGLVDPATCNSCQLASNAASDASCTPGPYTSINDWGYNPNLRHVHMVQKYGVVPQFPLERYVLGLSSPKVPDRNGEYPAGAGSYQGTKNAGCTNPLFAASLPDGSSTDAATLCHLPVGSRTPDLVYFAHIGGVPHQLLQEDATNPDSPQKAVLTDADWTKIVGADPLNENFTGIDPHMIESYQPRPGIAAAPTASLDPENGYDWVTDQGDQHVLQVDREYACTFALTTPRDCSNTKDPAVAYGCDCPATGSPPPVGLTPAELPPICNPQSPTQQTGAKAYPTQRELLLAKLMKAQGFVSSLCPIHVTPAPGQTELSDPLFGYNPAVNGIVDRLGAVLENTCLPQKLDQDACGSAECLVLVTLPNSQRRCADIAGLESPPSDILARFQNQQHDAWVAGGSAGVDPSTLPTCKLQQLSQLPPGAAPSMCPPPVGTFDTKGSCRGSSQPGWCYAAVPGCPQPQGIMFSTGVPPSGATVSLQCIESSPTPVGIRPDAATD
jgi:hypothetical protein